MEEKNSTGPNQGKAKIVFKLIGILVAAFLFLIAVDIFTDYAVNKEKPSWPEVLDYWWLDLAGALIITVSTYFLHFRKKK